MATADEKVGLLVELLQKIPRIQAFDAPAYAEKISQAAYSTQAMQHFDAGHVKGDASFSGTSFDGQDCKQQVNLLAAATFARALSNIDDGHGFARKVKKVGSQGRELKHSVTNELRMKLFRKRKGVSPP